MTDIIYFLPPFIAFILVAIGFNYQEYIAGIMGGIILFLFGVSTIISPITSLTTFLNTIIGVICFGYGGYIMIRGSVDKIQEVLK